MAKNSKNKKEKEKINNTETNTASASASAAAYTSKVHDSMSVWDEDDVDVLSV